MNRFRTDSAIVCLLVSLACSVAFALTGCQSTARTPQPSQATPPPLPPEVVSGPPRVGLQFLGLSLLTALEDGKSPAPSAKALALLNPTGTPVRETAVAEPISVREPLLLEWRGLQADTRITRARFSMDSGDSKSWTDATYDENTDHWRVSLEPLFGHGERSLVPNAVQSLSLNLGFLDDTEETYCLTFRVRSPIHGVSETQALIAPTGSWGELAKQAFDGYPLKSETLINSLPRPVRVWVKTTSEGLRLTSYHEIGRWNYPVAPTVVWVSPDRWNLGPTLSSLDHYKAELAVQPSQLLIHRGSSNETLFVSATGWVSFDLAPRETLKLDWMGSLSANTPACKFPGPVTKHLKWIAPFGVNYTETDEVEQFQAVGLALRGKWTRLIRYSETDVSEVPDFEDSSQLTQPVQAAFGTTDLENLPSMECVGLYPQPGM